MSSNRINHCHNIELALDNAAIEAAEGVTNQTTKITNNNQSKEDTTMNTSYNPITDRDEHIYGGYDLDDSIPSTQIRESLINNHARFNSKNCNIVVGKGRKAHQCKHSLTSGCTFKINGYIIYVCRQHFNKYNENTAPVYHFTDIKPVQEDTMSKHTNHGGFDQDDITDKENNDMDNEYDYDYEHSFIKQMELISGEYEIIERKGVYFPTVIHELCDHDECARIFDEYIKVEICECCELTPCPHYVAMPCLFHPQTWYEFGGYTHYGSEDMDCILACQLLGQHFFDTGQLNLSDLKTVTAPSPTCPSCKLLQVDGVNVTPEEMREAARQIESEINNQKRMENMKETIRVMDRNAQQVIDYINNKENTVNKPKITIAKTRTSDGTDNLWHIMTTFDAAMLCRLDTEDWDSIEVMQMQEIDENLLHRVVGICPKCISQTEDDKRHGGIDIDDPKIPNTNKEETKMDTTITTINHKEKGYIRCPKCSVELLGSDPENDWTRGAFHATVEQVRLCQTGTTIKPVLENGFVKASIWKGENGDTMETMRFATRKEAVVYQIAVKGNQPKYDEKRGCWTVTHKLS